MGPSSFDLSYEDVPTPWTKTYPLNVADPSETSTWFTSFVAEVDGACVGFCALKYSAWNSRMEIHHLYVDREVRAKGIGSLLTSHARTLAQEAGARQLWAETQNINVPAIEFYKAQGFRLTGLDTELYDGLNETALYFSMNLERS